ncbi:MAG: hypothetical protein RI936_1864 [Pseudomonadota bacterium]
MSAWPASHWRGVLAATTIALAALFVSEHYGGPAVLYALLLGMAFNFLAEDERVAPGMLFASGTVLRVGVALLGARIAAEQLALLTPGLLALLVGASFATVGASLVFNRWVRWPRAEAALAGGAVAICGASAAVALAAVLPRREVREQALLAVVVGVTALSTLAMILYPFLTKALGLSPGDAGLVLGGTIHDVAQVVGAGAILGPAATETATMAKMLRVALLVPMLLVFSVWFGAKREPGAQRVHWLRNVPLFLVGFVVLAALNVTGWMPAAVSAGLGQASRVLILVAIAALGIKTSLGKLRELGWAPLVLMALDSVFIATVVIAGVLLLR